MRKEIILPGIAVTGGIIGFFIRRWNLAEAFEPETGLAIPHSPSTAALIGLSAVIFVVFVLMCRGEYNSLPGGYDQAFQAKGNPAYLFVSGLSAILMGAAALVSALRLFDEYQAVKETFSVIDAQGTAVWGAILAMFPRISLSVLCLASFFGVLFAIKNNYQGAGRGRLSFLVLMPGYTFCIWLICAYQQWAGDPVILDYIYEMLAIITSLLGLCFTAGFSFEKIRVSRASLFSLLGIYFSLVTLADRHDMLSVLLYSFAILYLLASVAALLYQAQQPELLWEPPSQGEKENGGIVP